MVRGPFYLLCRDWLGRYLSVTFMMGDDANGFLDGGYHESTPLVTALSLSHSLARSLSPSLSLCLSLNRAWLSLRKNCSRSDRTYPTRSEGDNKIYLSLAFSSGGGVGQARYLSTTMPRGGTSHLTNQRKPACPKHKHTHTHTHITHDIYINVYI